MSRTRCACSLKYCVSMPRSKMDLVDERDLKRSRRQTASSFVGYPQTILEKWESRESAEKGVHLKCRSIHGCFRNARSDRRQCYVGPKCLGAHRIRIGARTASRPTDEKSPGRGLRRTLADFSEGDESLIPAGSRQKLLVDLGQHGLFLPRALSAGSSPRGFSGDRHEAPCSEVAWRYSGSRH